METEFCGDIALAPVATGPGLRSRRTAWVRKRRRRERSRAGCAGRWRSAGRRLRRLRPAGRPRRAAAAGAAAAGRARRRPGAAPARAAHPGGPASRIGAWPVTAPRAPAAWLAWRGGAAADARAARATARRPGAGPPRRPRRVHQPTALPYSRPRPRPGAGAGWLRRPTWPRWRMADMSSTSCIAVAPTCRACGASVPMVAVAAALHGPLRLRLGRERVARRAVGAPVPARRRRPGPMADPQRRRGVHPLVVGGDDAYSSAGAEWSPRGDRLFVIEDRTAVGPPPGLGGAHNERRLRHSPERPRSPRGVLPGYRLRPGVVAGRARRGLRQQRGYFDRAGVGRTVPGLFS